MAVGIAAQPLLPTDPRALLENQVIADLEAVRL